MGGRLVVGGFGVLVVVVAGRVDVMMTRAEHLRWAKDRALEYADMGDISQAIASLGSDLNKHPETKNHAAMELMMMLAMTGNLDGPGELRKFIEGFN